jgi:hypothetical protein
MEPRTWAYHEPDASVEFIVTVLVGVIWLSTSGVTSLAGTVIMPVPLLTLGSHVVRPEGAERIVKEVVAAMGQFSLQSLDDEIDDLLVIVYVLTGPDSSEVEAEVVLDPELAAALMTPASSTKSDSAPTDAVDASSFAFWFDPAGSYGMKYGFHRSRPGAWKPVLMRTLRVARSFLPAHGKLEVTPQREFCSMRAWTVLMSRRRDS